MFFKNPSILNQHGYVHIFTPIENFTSPHSCRPPIALPLAPLRLALGVLNLHQEIDNQPPAPLPFSPLHPLRLARDILKPIP
jgi:hypothetical protein